MSLKGNLLFNGDFETGTTEGWITGAFGKVFEFDFSASSEAKYRGSYGGLLYAGVDLADGYLAYNKTCSFEEYEAYLMIMYVKMVSGYFTLGKLYGLDDKGNLIDDLLIGYNAEEGVWRKYQAILRGFGDMTHFQIGLYAWCGSVDDKVYIDEAKLIPLRSVKGHVLEETLTFEGITADKEYYLTLACIGRCKIESIFRVTSVSGTNPTIKPYVYTGLFPDGATSLTIEHSTFTTEGRERKYFELPEISFVKLYYDVGGDSPSFNVKHYIRIYPL